MNIPHCILAEAVKKEMEDVGSHVQDTLKKKLSYCILAEAVKKDIEAVGSYIQVR